MLVVLMLSVVFVAGIISSSFGAGTYCGNPEYELIQNAVTWHEAQIGCDKINKQLVIIRSRAENNALEKYIRRKKQNNNRLNFWTNGYKLSGNRFYWYSYGKPLPMTYTNWLPGEPSGKNENIIEGYIEARHLYWNDVASNRRRYYVCQCLSKKFPKPNPPSPKLPKPNPPSPKLPKPNPPSPKLPNYDPRPSSIVPWKNCGTPRYELNEKRVTWNEAQIACDKRGLHLVIIRSQAENGALEKFLKGKKVNSRRQAFWTAGYKPTGNIFYWYSYGQLFTISYTNWNAGEPNNAGKNENAIEGYIEAGHLLWNDVANYKKNPYVCQCPSPKLPNYDPRSPNIPKYDLRSLKPPSLGLNEPPYKGDEIPYYQQ